MYIIYILATVVVAFFATNLFGYVVHWSLHQRWMGKVNKSHMTHHLVLYPPKDFFSKVYRHAGKDSTPRFFAVASIPMIIIPILFGLLGFLPWYLVIIALVVEVALGLLHNYLHDVCHIKDHWMNRVPGFNKIFHVWLGLHYTHHVDMSKNFGVFNFNWDRIFGTYQK